MEEEDTDIEILDADDDTAALGRRNPVVALAKKDEDRRSRNAITFMAALIVIGRRMENTSLFCVSLSSVTSNPWIIGSKQKGDGCGMWR